MPESLKRQHIVVRIILFLIPFINWIVEVVVRAIFMVRRTDVKNIVMFVLSLVGLGNIMGWIDFFFILLKGRYFLD